MKFIPILLLLYQRLKRNGQQNLGSCCTGRYTHQSTFPFIKRQPFAPRQPISSVSILQHYSPHFGEWNALATFPQYCSVNLPYFIPEITITTINHMLLLYRSIVCTKPKLLAELRVYTNSCCCKACFLIHYKMPTSPHKVHSGQCICSGLCESIVMLLPLVFKQFFTLVSNMTRFFLYAHSGMQPGMQRWLQSTT